jgi:hypothetical protein
VPSSRRSTEARSSDGGGSAERLTEADEGQGVGLGREHGEDEHPELVDTVGSEKCPGERATAVGAHALDAVLLAQSSQRGREIDPVATGLDHVDASGREVLEVLAGRVRGDEGDLAAVPGLGLCVPPVAHLSPAVDDHQQGARLAHQVLEAETRARRVQKVLDALT